MSVLSIIFVVKLYPYIRASACSGRFYMEAYEHCTSRATQKQLASAAIALMYARPRHDFEASTFVAAYRAEISLLRSQSVLLSSVFATPATELVSFAGHGIVCTAAVAHCCDCCAVPSLYHTHTHTHTYSHTLNTILQFSLTYFELL